MRSQCKQENKRVTIVDDIEAALKAKGWKKRASVMYFEMNAETISHINVFVKKTDSAEQVIRAQFETSNKLLNRASWDVFGLPANFGTVKDHLINGCKCQMFVALEGLEFSMPYPSAADLADTISNFGLQHSRSFDSLDKVRHQLSIAPVLGNPRYDIQRLCVELAKNNTAPARDLIAQKRREDEHGLFETTFFGCAARFLDKRAA